MGCTVTRSKQVEMNSVQGSTEYVKKNATAQGGSRIRKISDGQAERRQEINNVHPHRLTAPTNNNFTWLISSSPGQARTVWTEEES